jgi:multiple sugar transport system substrate-binding protein
MQPVANAGIARDDYFAGILDTNVMPTPSGNRLFGLPWYVDTRVLFYRSDLLRAAGHAQPPQSWAEWLTAMRAVRQAGGGRSYGALLPLNEPDPLYALALQQGALLADNDTRGAFSRRLSGVRSASTQTSSARVSPRR